ncbi:DUF3575 domain-containing protein [Dysgonomonas sp. GY75]|uniref:DUF3575 domain-containing protein n=1 Tax=Dysgonomonas sp. GY75 TaxID=2780419 RepID=UPI001883DDCF|nr:DUF3575 domain-containing protein [Dysgonomonas sp. GY75]MBF0647208.1 DUF3575 domain-containing protein [Dysgonomonas sp. GY75]
MRIFTFILLFFCIGTMYAQDKAVTQATPAITVNSNLLYDVTTNLNLGVEIRTGDRYTLKLPVTYNPWEYGTNKLYRFILVQPEFRRWLCESFNGHFFGIHALYAHYDIGGIGIPYSGMKGYRYQGDAYGAGISYGYQFYLSPRWNLELSAGIGYAYLDYDKYECRECVKYAGHLQKNYWGPTQAGITLIYIIK